MQRTSFILLLAAASYYAAAPANAAADTAKCTSIQAKCAVEAGGRCDAQTGHWCYGSYKGQACGGNGAAFRSCMSRHGVQVYGPQVPKAPGPAATMSDLGKCTSIQAQCAIEIGGTCDRNTGSWCFGPFQQRQCGGSPVAGGAFDACVSRRLAGHK